MCELKDIINIDDVRFMYRLCVEGKHDEFNQLLQNSLSPKIIDSKFISLAGWKLDTSGITYTKAKPADVIEGWQFLLDRNIPLDIYTNAFLITSLYSLPDNVMSEIEVNAQTEVSNLLEPELLEQIYSSPILLCEG